MDRVEIKDQFYVDGEPFRLISGSIHYFRIVPEYWSDRLEKLKAMGCNAVETYIPWNMHEPQKGKFVFDGILNIETFIKKAQSLDLYVILRPSPYICAEWEFGGLPAWLLKEDGMKLRCSYEPYLRHVRDYYKILIPLLVPYQIDRGGPVLMMQIENEYGYYGDDTSYLQTIKNMMREYGVTVPLFTSDGPFDESFRCGKLDGILQTGNFGSHAKERFEFMKKHVGDAPLACMEFWLGWFDNWGCGEHHTTSLEQNKLDLEYMLDHGNVNIYMFIGGTNFGFMNGSNYYDELTPDVTSYDYDAVLTEDGQITEKYKAFQKAIAERYLIPEVKFSREIKRKAYGTIRVTEKVGLFESLSQIAKPVKSVYPVSMEKLDQSYGYILYHSTLDRQEEVNQLRLLDANDRAKIFVDETPVLTLYDRELLEGHKLEEAVPCRMGESTIDILMENMGRVNFGPRMEKQRKGIDGGIIINDHQHFHWDICTLPLDNLHQLDFSRGYTEGNPAFHRFVFMVEEQADTFLEMERWGKGCVFVNGFNLGRFWQIGPQKNLYLPGPLLKRGENEILIFETEGIYEDHIVLSDTPNLG